MLTAINQCKQEGSRPASGVRARGRVAARHNYSYADINIDDTAPIRLDGAITGADSATNHIHICMYVYIRSNKYLSCSSY